MTFGSLFSGAGMFDLGLERAGWECRWQVEIDKAANKVLAHHWPNVKRYTDIREADGHDLEPVDLVCGGWPCQDLSMAGKRAGLGGERSGLFGEVVRILGERRPEWFLLENVPGLLSSWSPVGDTHLTVAVEPGRERRVDVEERSDTAEVIAALVGVGYGVAWRVLDAQFFHLAQRRQRVFLVGCLGNWTGASEILFEPESCAGDSPPRRRAEARVAGTVAAGAHPGGFNGRDAETGNYAVASPLCAGYAKGEGHNHGKKGNPQNLVVANTLQSRQAKGEGVNKPGRGGEDDANLVVAHTLKAEGHDASEDGTGRGVPLVTVAAPLRTNIYNNSDPGMEATMPLIFQTRIARNGRGGPSETVPTLTSCEGGTHADSKPHVASTMGVRRLMPVECERLMGLPDGWTEAAGSDAARYRLIGNGGAVPVLEWIGCRIAASQENRA